MTHISPLARAPRRPALIVAGLALLALAGCAAPRTGTGTGGGGIDAQASFAAYAVAVQRALEYLPDAAEARWTDPSDGRTLELTVLSTEVGPSDSVCRLVRIEAGNSSDATVQRFCRDDASGSWQFDAGAV